MRGQIAFRDLGNGIYTTPTESLKHAWDSIRVPILVPILRIAMFVCIMMSVMLFLERIYMAVVIVGVKCFGKKRYTKYKLDATKEDLEQNQNYPKVLVQIPMFNEKEVQLFKIFFALVTNVFIPR